MGTKEQWVKDFLKGSVSKLCCGGKTKGGVSLPPILSIMADLIDIHNSQDDKKKCEVVSVEVNEQKRIFYIYLPQHKMIYAKLEELPNELRITSKSSSKEQFSILVQIEGLTIIKHYNENEMQCGYSLESYMEILSTIFFFCPYILWTAIQEELQPENENEKLDEVSKAILHAIHSCLAFYLTLERLEIEADGDVPQNKNKVLKGINNAKQISQIENVIITQTCEKNKRKGDCEKIDHAECVMQVAGIGLQIIREQLINMPAKKKRLKEVLGGSNYKNIMIYSKNTYYFKEGD